jgi:copper chaperone CopZ
MFRSKSWMPLFPAVLLITALALPMPVRADGSNAYPKDSYVLQVNGLACPYCAYGLEKQFARQRGVTKTDIDIVKGVAVVHVRPGTRFTDARLKRLVYDAGFALRRIVHRPGGGRS